MIKRKKKNNKKEEKVIIKIADMHNFLFLVANSFAFFIEQIKQ